MSKRQTIPVTEEIIEAAQRADSGHCMIADAIKAVNPLWTNVAVDLQTIRVTDRAQRQRFVWLTPVELQQQLLRFDQGVKVEPFAFRLPRIVSQVVPVQERHAKTEKSTLKSNGSRRIPTVHGGKEPPAAVLSHSRGRRRIFGIRAAKGFNPNE